MAGFFSGIKTGWSRSAPLNGGRPWHSVTRAGVGEVVGRCLSLANPKQYSIVQGLSDGWHGELPGGSWMNGERLGHAMGSAPAKIKNMTGNMRGGVTKFALGFGALVGGAMLLNSLAGSGKRAPSPEEMQEQIAAKADTGQVLPASAVMPQMPQYPEATIPSMPQSADQIPGMPAMPDEPESFEHRNRVMAERGQQIPGQPAQPEFVAPKSSIAEELMQPRPASTVEAVSQKKDVGLNAQLGA